MTKAKKKKKSVSDSKLMGLWRQAVLAHWNYTDPLSGTYDPTGESLQCHHLVKRRHLLLRWDYRNGVPLTVESHQRAHTLGGSNELLKHIGMQTQEYLEHMERYTAKEWFQEKGITDNEFREMKRDELQAVVSANR